MRDIALECLSKESLLHIDMLEAIRRGNADIIYESLEGVLLKERCSGAYMLSSMEYELGRGLLEKIDGPELLVVHQEALAGYAYSKFKFANIMECYQAVYTSRQKPILTKGLEIRRPSEDEFILIRSSYGKISDEELYRINEMGNLYVGLSGGNMIGFVGSHLEGSMGLLEIFPEYRRLGFGTELEKHMICLMMDRGYVPFAQIESHNNSSLAMQRKLGLEISKDKIYWLI